jgi:hypothetical protein
MGSLGVGCTSEYFQVITSAVIFRLPRLCLMTMQFAEMLRIHESYFKFEIVGRTNDRVYFVGERWLLCVAINLQEGSLTPKLL